MEIGNTVEVTWGKRGSSPVKGWVGMVTDLGPRGARIDFGAKPYRDGGLAHVHMWVDTSILKRITG